MSRSSGTYTAPTNSWNPAVDGTAIDVSDWNDTLTDIEEAISASTYTAGLGATDNALVRTDGTDTKKVQAGSGVTLSDTGVLAGAKATPTGGNTALNISDMFAYTVNVKAYGATGDGTTDDRTALQAALDACPDGGTVFVPPATVAYNISANLTWPLNKAIWMVGCGWLSWIRPAAGYSASADIINITPTVGTRGGGFYNLRIGGGASALGRHAIHVNTSDAGNAASWYSWKIEKVLIDPTSAGQSIKLTSTSSADGFFLGRIANCNIDSINLLYAGDFITIEHNAINSAVNSGIEYTGVSGAANLFVNHNNISVKGTSIAVHACVGPMIAWNTCEQSVNSDAANAAQIDITGSITNVWNPIILGNKCQINAGITGITQNIRLAACTNAIVKLGRLERRTATYHVAVTAAAADAIIEPNVQFVASDAIGGPAINDAGTRTGYSGMIPTTGKIRWGVGGAAPAEYCSISGTSGGALTLTAQNGEGVYAAGAGLFPALNATGDLGAAALAYRRLFTAGATFAKEGALTLANGANSDIALPEATWIAITGPTGAFNITGFASPVNGQEIEIYNTTSQTMTITNDATSTAANRILTLTGADVALTGTSVARFRYSTVSSRWILLSTQG